MFLRVREDFWVNIEQITAVWNDKHGMKVFSVGDDEGVDVDADCVSQVMFSLGLKED